MNTFQLRILWALLPPRDQCLLKISRLYLSDKSEKNISVYQWPHKGATFRSAIAVPHLRVLYVCPVFRSDLVLFNFHSDGTADFLFLLFCFLFFFLCGKICIMWLIECRNIAIIKWRISVIRSVWIKIITEWNIRSEVMSTSSLKLCSLLHSTLSKTNIFRYSVLQAARYRRGTDRMVQERQGIRTDTWSKFRVQILCPSILKSHKPRAEI